MNEQQDRKKLIIFTIIIVGLLSIMLASSVYTNSKIAEIVKYDNSSSIIIDLKRAVATLWISALVSIFVDIVFVLKRKLFNIVGSFENELYSIVTYIVLIFFNFLIWYEAISPFVTYRDLVMKAVINMFRILQ